MYLSDRTLFKHFYYYENIILFNIQSKVSFNFNKYNNYFVLYNCNN